MGVLLEDDFYQPYWLKNQSSETAVQRCFKNMQQIYRRTPMPKCDFKWMKWAWVFSCKFAEYFQNTFS